MTATTAPSALSDRLFEAALGAIDLASVYLGDRLGLYVALGDGPATAGELAARAGVHERYAREWLEQQAVTGILEVDDVAAAAEERRYAIPAPHREALLDRDSLDHVPPLARIVMSLFGPLPALLDAYRTGGGVPWADYGADARESQADSNGVQFLHLMGEWLAAIPDVHERLGAPGARVADVACGGGLSSIAIARAYPGVRVDGFDADEASIDLARDNAAAYGVADRVSFHVRDASDEPSGDGYDLVTVFEAIHDMPRPVEALASLRAMAGAHGAVLVMDERIAETFTAPGEPLERFHYGASIFVCLPTSMSEQPSAAIGTVMRPATFESLAKAAGFEAVDVLPIDHEFWRFYRLR
jgi:2-polyprenyl-3-methyl-5-hydroxy-6-metoxy-1,4-benzoquinol methylase